MSAHIFASHILLYLFIGKSPTAAVSVCLVSIRARLMSMKQYC